MPHRLALVVLAAGLVFACGEGAERGWKAGAGEDLLAILQAEDRLAVEQALRESETPFSAKARTLLLALTDQLNAQTQPAEREVFINPNAHIRQNTQEEVAFLVLIVGEFRIASLPGAGELAGAFPPLCLVEEDGEIEVRPAAPVSTCFEKQKPVG